MKAALMAKQFAIEGRLVKVSPHGTGNVNDTFLGVARTTFNEQRFILQRLRRAVFPHPENLFHNLRIITDHAHAQFEAEAEHADRIWQLPKLIPAKNGLDYVMDSSGDFWRAITHISSAASYEQVQSPEHAQEVGLVLGQFHRVISDIPCETLTIALEGFHITPGYLSKYDAAMATPEGRQRLADSPNAKYCSDFIEKRREFAYVLEKAKERGDLLMRPIHGDPKVGNIMIDDETGKGTCIVDLDTVQPGLVHYDIGDCVRSVCNPAGEDARDLRDVYCDLDLLEQVMHGYLSQARQFLTDADRAYLYDAIRLIAFELGLRFFGDFIAGDTYFRVRYEGHNLNRAMVQFKLVESIETREKSIRKIIESF